MDIKSINPPFFHQQTVHKCLVQHSHKSCRGVSAGNLNHRHLRLEHFSIEFTSKTQILRLALDNVTVITLVAVMSQFRAKSPVFKVHTKSTTEAEWG